MQPLSRLTYLLKDTWCDIPFGFPVNVIYIYNKTEENDLDLGKTIPTTQPFHFVPLSEYGTYVTPTAIRTSLSTHAGRFTSDSELTRLHPKGVPPQRKITYEF